LKTEEQKKIVLTDASMIITEACVQSGADVFIGYPITPSNRFYQYGGNRFPLFLAGPDEITVMQWMAGLSTAGRFPVTATAFPGLALMMEGLNMSYMMELPMLLIITQRLGPSTGSATTGAQGDLGVLHGAISGGYPLPVFCPSDFEDSWYLTHEAIKTSIALRTPVVLLTSKEMVMTSKSFDISDLKPLERLSMNFDSDPIELPYQTYRSGQKMVPPFVPAGNDEYQVRFNSSTHDNEGMIRKNNPESLNNTRRLKEKIEKRLNEYTFFEYDQQDDSKDLIVSYGISAEASRDACAEWRKSGHKASLLIVKTLLPVAPDILGIIRQFERVHFVEENITGLYREIIFGKMHADSVFSVEKIGSMITPEEIIKSLQS